MSFFLHIFYFPLPFKQPFVLLDMFFNSFLPICDLMLFPSFIALNLQCTCSCIQNSIQVSCILFFSRERNHPPVTKIVWRYINVIMITQKITVYCGSSLSGKQSACLHSDTADGCAPKLPQGITISFYLLEKGEIETLADKTQPLTVLPYWDGDN